MPCEVVTVKTARTKRTDLFIVFYRSATDVQADLQTICRSSAACLQNICRISAECLYIATICNKSANLQTLCRRNQPIMLNKEPTKCTNQTKPLFKRQTGEVGMLIFIKLVNITRTKMLGETSQTNSQLLKEGTTYNHLKPPKTTYNHLQPPRKIQQPSTTTSKTSTTTHKQANSILNKP